MLTEHRSIAALRILVAEDDGSVAEAICDRLSDAGVQIVARVDTGAGAVEAALALRPDLILMDVRLKGDMDGIRASELINEKKRVPVIYLAWDSDQKTLRRAKAASAFGYVLKPFHIRKLMVAIEMAVDRFEMERRLEDSQLTYATALHDAVRREQRRFGRDLHDGLGQELTGLSLLLSALTNSARAAQSPHAADLDQASKVARHALQACQTIARGLSPIGPTEGGLIGALRDLVTRLKGLSRPIVDISVSEVARLGLSPAASDHLYRIAQEALANALKHAHANAIKVTLDVEREHVRLEICDDGCGVRESGQNALGLGLRTMQYRASIIGARFEITPFLPAGTRVICDCPQPG